MSLPARHTKGAGILPSADNSISEGRNLDQLNGGAAYIFGAIQVDLLDSKVSSALIDHEFVLKDRLESFVGQFLDDRPDILHREGDVLQALTVFSKEVGMRRFTFQYFDEFDEYLARVGDRGLHARLGGLTPETKLRRFVEYVVVDREGADAENPLPPFSRLLTILDNDPHVRDRTQLHNRYFRHGIPFTIQSLSMYSLIKTMLNVSKSTNEKRSSTARSRSLSLR